jgi:hypothetical protein
MSRLIELTDDEIRVLSSIMSKIELPIVAITNKTPKKVSKTELIRQAIMDARAKKALRKQNN